MEQWIFPLSASFFKSPLVMAESCLPERAVLESSGLLPWSCLQRRVLRRLVAPRRMWDDDNAPLLFSPLSQIKLIDWGNGVRSRGESASFVVWWQGGKCWGYKPLPLLGLAPCQATSVPRGGDLCLSAQPFPLLPPHLEETGMGQWGAVGIGMDLRWAALLSAGLGWKGVSGPVGNGSLRVERAQHLWTRAME